MSEVSFHIASECNLHVCDFQWLLALSKCQKRRKKYCCKLRSYARFALSKLRLHPKRFAWIAPVAVPVQRSWWSWSDGDHIGMMSLRVWQYDHVSHVGRSTWPSTVLWMPPVPPTGLESLSNIFVFSTYVCVRYTVYIYIYMHTS